MIKTIPNDATKILRDILPRETRTLHFICEQAYNDSYYQPSPKEVWLVDENNNLIQDMSFIDFEQLIYNRVKYNIYSKLIWEFDFDGLSSELQYISVPLDYSNGIP